MSALDDAITAHVKEVFGDDWHTLAYVVYARVTDVESLTADEPIWVIPDGQRSFVTRGLLEEALSEHESDNLPIFTYAEADDDDDFD